MSKEMISLIKEMEARQDFQKLTRYTDVGKWIWKQKARFYKLPLSQRNELIQLKSFEGFRASHFDYEQEEWLRMYAICRSFEEENGAPIVFREIVGTDPIGRWLTQARSKFIAFPDPKANPIYKQKLQQLETIRTWDQHRTLSQSEQSQRQWDETVKSLGSHPYRRSVPPPRPVPQTRNPYDVLQVQPGADFEIIKAVFRRLSLTHHPDQGGNNAKYVEILEAFRTIESAQNHQ